MHVRAASNLKRKYSYRPPPAHHRLGLSANPPKTTAAKILESVDQRPLLTAVRDQMTEGDCFAFGGCALKEFNCAVYGGKTAPLGEWLSTAYLAWKIHMADGTFPSDAGSSVAETMLQLHIWGACPENFLPYRADPSQAGDAACDVAAEPYRMGIARNVDFMDPDAIKIELSQDHCVAVGFQVFQSFEETGADGIVKMASDTEGLLGGHFVLLCGYDSRGWIIRNSWGEKWGDRGYCYMPYGYEQFFMEAMTDP
jgi:hypothetical protein